MAYVYPGQAFDHTLGALKGWSRDVALDTEVILSSNININSDHSPVVSGLCVHAESLSSVTDVYGASFVHKSPVVELGCGPGDGVPLFLWPNAFDPDVSNPGTIPGDPVYGTTARPPDFVSAQPSPSISGATLFALVALGGYELETTEYDTDQTYTVGQALRAVTSNTNVNGGKLTNQRGATAAFNSDGVVQYVANSTTVSTWDTIVGFVSRGAATNANRRSLLAFYPGFWPGNR